MSRKTHGFGRVAKIQKFNTELTARKAGRQEFEIRRLRQLIRAAAWRADAIGLAYDEFDALIQEVESWGEGEPPRPDNNIAG